jgi:hypothetical protein
MSVLAASQGVLSPEEFSIVKSVFDRVVSEPWVPKEPDQHEEIAKFVLNVFERGVIDPNRLYDVSVLTAKHKFLHEPLPTELDEENSDPMRQDRG